MLMLKTVQSRRYNSLIYGIAVVFYFFCSNILIYSKNFMKFLLKYTHKKNNNNFESTTDLL